MALTEFEVKRITRLAADFCRSRSPKRKDVWDQLHIDFDLIGQSLVIVEVRPDWQDASIVHRRPFAKATYTKVSGLWKVYWMRSTLKWEHYEPHPEVARIEHFLQVVNDDEYHCFFG